MTRRRRLIGVLALVAAASACAGGSGAVRPGLLVPAAPVVRRECVAAARAVGYPVPCPTRLLPDMRPFPGGSDGGPRCRMQFIGAERCSPAWRGWVVGSSIAGDEHLVIQASPRPIRGYAKVINGPAWYSGAAERVGGWLTVRGRRARWVFVPPRTNDGSAFSDHLVLVWTTGGHTYAAGFHDVSADTRGLDRALMRSILLVGP